MQWRNAFYALTGQPEVQAALIGMAWITAHESRNAALLSNLLHNMLDPSGVCRAMDAVGIPVPPEALPKLPSSDGGILDGTNRTTGGWIGQP